MFPEYYGVINKPFGITPDPRFLYLGSKHRQALAALDYGTETNRGFLTLIAKPGMGKMPLHFRYVKSLRNKARTAFLFQTDGDSRDLMRYLLADLGLDGTGKDLPGLRSMHNIALKDYCLKPTGEDNGGGLKVSASIRGGNLVGVIGAPD